MRPPGQAATMRPPGQAAGQRRAGHPPGMALIGVNFRPPQATRQGWPYYIRIVRILSGLLSSLVGPPLAGGLLAAGWPATDRKPYGRSLPVHFFSTLVVVGANQHDANHHAENEGQQEEYQDGLDV